METKLGTGVNKKGVYLSFLGVVFFIGYYKCPYCEDNQSTKNNIHAIHNFIILQKRETRAQRFQGPTKR